MLVLNLLVHGNVTNPKPMASPVWWVLCIGHSVNCSFPVLVVTMLVSVMILGTLLLAAGGAASPPCLAVFDIMASQISYF